MSFDRIYSLCKRGAGITERTDNCQSFAIAVKVFKAANQRLLLLHVLLSPMIIMMMPLQQDTLKGARSNEQGLTRSPAPLAGH